MNNFRSLLDENPFLQQRAAEIREEGLDEGLQAAVLIAVEVRFPALIDLALREGATHQASQYAQTLSQRDDGNFQ